MMESMPLPGAGSGCRHEIYYSNGQNCPGTQLLTSQARMPTGHGNPACIKILDSGTVYKSAQAAIIKIS